MEVKCDMLYEVSWEVCNKVGGIYTVVKSKVERMKEHYPGYCLIGPYFTEKARIETQQLVPPESLKKVFDTLEKEGIVCYYGKWHVKGDPEVILINTQNILNRKDDIKKSLWESDRIDTLNSNWDYEEPMIWAYAVGRLLSLLEGKKTVAHFHEWLAGGALLHLKSSGSTIKTVFTTHATMLGRAIAGSGKDLYSILDMMDPDQEARNHNVVDKFQTERACANKADVFTTVSEITSIEAKKILGRKADVLLLNGLDIQKFPNFEECSIKHKEYRDVIRDFMAYYFFPYYTFDLEKSLIFFIVGRYEFKNKGLDIFIKALGRLNERLKKEGYEKTIVTFFWIPSGVTGVRTELLESEDRFEQVKEIVNRRLPGVRDKLIQEIMKDGDIKPEDIFDDEFLNDAKKLKLQFIRQGSPFLSTHYLENERDDPIINEFGKNGLLNRADDKVKVIFYPVYLDGNDNLISLKYYDALQGCHLGVFPSYYEPWGYTPLESAALGVPALTTDFAGFGRYIRAEIKDSDQGGIFILDRYNRDETDSIKRFADILYSYSGLNKKERVEQKMRAKELAEVADWRVMIENYIKAHNLALEKNA